MPETGARNDPFVAFRFELSFNDLPVAGFSECRGLEIEIEIKEYAEGGLHDHTHRFPTRAKPATLVLRRGIVDEQIWKWCRETAGGEIRLRDGSVVVRDLGGDAVMLWEFKRALPSKWSGPELDAKQSEVAMETLELVHHGLERIR
jgi:phage tail-like protein